MGPIESIESCFVLGIPFFNSFKFRNIKYDASDIEILSWVVVSLVKLMYCHIIYKGKSQSFRCSSCSDFILGRIPL